jgi:hypothetical protein
MHRSTLILPFQTGIDKHLHLGFGTLICLKFTNAPNIMKIL